MADVGRARSGGDAGSGNGSGRHRRRGRLPTPQQLGVVAAAAVLVPAFVGGLWTVTGSGSFWHGFKVMAVFNLILIAVIVGGALALARRDMRPPVARAPAPPPRAGARPGPPRAGGAGAPRPSPSRPARETTAPAPAPTPSSPRGHVES